MLEFLKRLFSQSSTPKYFPGLIIDAQNDLGGINFEDIVVKANTVEWKSLDTTKLPDWPVLDQKSTGSCVAHTYALMVTIMYYLRTGIMMTFSPKWLYNWRVNKNQGDGQGMVGIDAFNIGATQGIIPEAMMPFTGNTEAEINVFKPQPWEKEVGKAFRTSDQRIILPIGDIDVLASVIETTKKPIMVWFKFNFEEWKTVPDIMVSDPNINHSTTAIPPRLIGQMSYGMYQGQKAVAIQESWGLNSTNLSGKRIIKQDFYKTRNFFACYTMRFKFDEGQGARPIYDGTIVSLQKCLQFEGCFPMNVSFVESMGPVTRSAIAQFCQNHGFTTPVISGTIIPAVVDLELKKLYK